MRCGMENRTLKERLSRYIDAGFPIIYLNTFEEDKVNDIIFDISSGLSEEMMFTRVLDIRMGC